MVRKPAEIVVDGSCSALLNGSVMGLQNGLANAFSSGKKNVTRSGPVSDIIALVLMFIDS